MFNSAVVVQNSLCTQANEHVCVPIKLYLWTLKFEFHMTFTSLNIIFLLIFSPPLRKAILSLWAVQKQVVRTPHSHCREPSSFPGQGTKMPQATPDDSDRKSLEEEMGEINILHLPSSSSNIPSSGKCLMKSDSLGLDLACLLCCGS